MAKLTLYDSTQNIIIKDIDYDRFFDSFMDLAEDLYRKGETNIKTFYDRIDKSIYEDNKNDMEYDIDGFIFKYPEDLPCIQCLSQKINSEFWEIMY